MKRPGWRRSNKTLYLERPNLSAGDPFANEAYRSVIARASEIAEIVGDDDLVYEAPFKADRACACHGVLVCPGGRMLPSRAPSPGHIWTWVEHGDRGGWEEVSYWDKAGSVTFQVGDVVRAVDPVAKHFMDQFGIPIEASVTSISGAGDLRFEGMSYGVAGSCFKLVRRAGEPAPEALPAGWRRDEGDDCWRFMYVHNSGARVWSDSACGPFNYRHKGHGFSEGSHALLAAAMEAAVPTRGHDAHSTPVPPELATLDVRHYYERPVPPGLAGSTRAPEPALPPLPEGMAWTWRAGRRLVVSRDGRRLLMEDDQGLWFAPIMGTADPMPTKRPTVYDALADALWGERADVGDHELVMSRGWDGPMTRFHGVRYTGHYESRTIRGRMLEHEARVLAAERGRS